MQEKSLLRLAILCSIIGLLILIFVSNTIEPQKLKIKDITKEHVGQAIKTQGTISSIQTIDELTILEITDKTSKIKVIAFANTTLSKNNNIEIEGIVKEYKDELEIEADIIKII